MLGLENLSDLQLGAFIAGVDSCGDRRGIFCVGSLFVKKGGTCAASKPMYLQSMLDKKHRRLTSSPDRFRVQGLTKWELEKVVPGNGTAHCRLGVPKPGKACSAQKLNRP